VVGRAGAAPSGAGRIQAVKLVVALDGLLLRFGRLVPDAMDMLHRLADIKAQASPPHPRLEVALASFGGGESPDWHATGLDAARRTLDATTMDLRDGADLAGGRSASTGVMLLAGCEQQAKAAIGAGLPAYHVSDRPPRAHWHLAVRDVPRVVREALRMPVPRALPDPARRGSLVATPEGGAAAGRARGAIVLGQDPNADWATVDGTHIFYAEDPHAIAALLALPQARPLATHVTLGSVGLALHARTGPDTLLVFRAHALVAPAQAGDLRWEHVRRARRGTTPHVGSTVLQDERGPYTLDGRVCLGFETADADHLLVFTLDAALERASALAMAARLRHLVGGDAVVLGTADTQPLDVLWRAERNQLRAIVHLQASGAAAIHRSEDGSLPTVPVLTVSGCSAAPQGHDWAARLAAQLRSS
jgi:hypothetical protein